MVKIKVPNYKERVRDFGAGWEICLQTVKREIQFSFNNKKNKKIGK